MVKKRQYGDVGKGRWSSALGPARGLAPLQKMVSKFLPIIFFPWITHLEMVVAEVDAPHERQDAGGGHDQAVFCIRPNTQKRSAHLNNRSADWIIDTWTLQNETAQFSMKTLEILRIQIENLDFRLWLGSFRFDNDKYFQIRENTSRESADWKIDHWIPRGVNLIAKSIFFIIYETWGLTREKFNSSTFSATPANDLEETNQQTADLTIDW